MIRERAGRIYPEDQLDLVRDFTWFDPSMLDGFAGCAADVLEECAGLSDERISAIVRRVEKNVKAVISRSQRQSMPKAVGKRKAYRH